MQELIFHSLHQAQIKMRGSALGAHKTQAGIKFQLHTTWTNAKNKGLLLKLIENAKTGLQIAMTRKITENQMRRLNMAIAAAIAMAANTGAWAGSNQSPFSNKDPYKPVTRHRRNKMSPANRIIQKQQAAAINAMYLRELVRKVEAADKLNNANPPALSREEIDVVRRGIE